ncbi:hypothetical protein RSOLAG22IIIB_00627 [Rhizoctonia solani]|uniref:NYN domain-containing protein n=1 Tax=Rhizoctonia solani TaxID=456999 RepID=A0A0K6FWA4_9AGAM|nr:hypothetical protein RSOLAG22IIIB_00627 [Rhizoctonia solani]
MLKRVGIFWDYSSCPSNNAEDISTIVTTLREGCTEYGSTTLFRVYFGLPNSTPYEQPSASMRSELEEVGAIIVDNPKAGIGALATDVLSFLLDYRDPSESTTVVFVSGNPDIAYLISALRARGVGVGLIAPSDHSNKLSPWASWTANWDNYTTGSRPPSSFRPPLTLESIPGPCGNFESMMSSITYNSGNIPLSSETKHETTKAPEATMPIFGTQYLPLESAQVVPDIKIQQPLRPPQSQYYSFSRMPFLTTTTSHELQIFEDDPLYAELIKDPEAIKIKTWRRKLKQLFFCQDISKNSNIQSDLDAIFTSLEKYDKMSKNYLAHYLNQFDYRQASVKRARDLLGKWEPLVTFKPAHSAAAV